MQWYFVVSRLGRITATNDAHSDVTEGRRVNQWYLGRFHEIPVSVSKKRLVSTSFNARTPGTTGLRAAACSYGTFARIAAVATTQSHDLRCRTCLKSNRSILR
jgi:hypothetical protein